MNALPKDTLWSTQPYLPTPRLSTSSNLVPYFVLSRTVSCSKGTRFILNAVLCFLFFYFIFLGQHPRHMEVPRLGSNWGYSCPPTPQPQQHRCRGASVTYTTAHSNARSLTHWVRPGIEPTTSWFLAGFVSAVPRQELLNCICIRVAALRWNYCGLRWWLGWWWRKVSRSLFWHSTHQTNWHIVFDIIVASWLCSRVSLPCFQELSNLLDILSKGNQVLATWQWD